MENNFSAVQTERSCALRKMPVVTNVDANTLKRGVETRITEIAGPEIKLLPEPGIDVWNVVLAILAEILPVRIDHRGGVVIDAGDLFFIDRHDDHHAVFFGDFLHQPHGWTIGNPFHRFVPARLLFGAKVRRREDLLHADYLHTLFGSLFDKVKVFLNIELLDLLDRQIGGSSIRTLYQCAFNRPWH